MSAWNATPIHAALLAIQQQLHHMPVFFLYPLEILIQPGSAGSSRRPEASQLRHRNPSGGQQNGSGSYLGLGSVGRNALSHLYSISPTGC